MTTLNAQSESYRLVQQAVNDTNQDQAVALLTEAHSLDPTAKLPLYHLGMIKAGRGLHSAAAIDYRMIVEHVDPDDAPIWFLLARQLQLAGDNDDALRAYQETIARDPICEKAYLYTAEIMLATKRSSAKALTFAEAARRIRPITSMVPVEEFERVVLDAKQAVENSVSSNPAVTTDEVQLAIVSPAPYRTVPVRTLLLRYPDAEGVLEAHGIQCASCVGYGDQSIEDLAEPLGLDLPTIDKSLRLIIEEGL